MSEPIVGSLSTQLHAWSAGKLLTDVVAHQEVQAAVVGASQSYDVENANGSEAGKEAKDQDRGTQDERPLPAAQVVG